MTNTNDDQRLALLLEGIELPGSATDAAERRYKDLATWISDPKSSISKYDPHIFVQGSFAFGTAIRPLNSDEEYDLDFSCKLRSGLDRTNVSQKALKQLVHGELEAYRQARNIANALQEKNRCWRLSYRDTLPFHMDVVPSIPADERRRQELKLLIESAGIDSRFAADVANLSLWITDKQQQNYATIDADWPSSNPEGYLRWFVSRMTPQARGLLAEAQVDPVPEYRRNTPLQQVIKLLKRHRDVMFMDLPEAKPISIIITTVVGESHVSGDSLSETMRKALNALEKVRLSNTDIIKNPINPMENFADRWARHDCAKLELKKNFHAWVVEVNRHFSEMRTSQDPQRLLEIASDHFMVKPNEETVRRLLGVSSGLMTGGTPARRVTAGAAPASPWAF